MSDKELNNTDSSQANKPKKKSVSGMYKNWFLDYASYVILERAVPHAFDGLKPVHRRILHAMKRLDDGRYNKVANIIGYTMQYHPHGDASIGDALVQLGQKDLLVDTQGNWGNILTGDGSAAPRYIEARLSKFALAVVFNPKTTKWKLSYDGRNKEPINLPVKFPLLLAQGVEGIAVGLASKILPHNFNELIDASIKYLKNKDFVLYPDFPTGGMIDVSKYNDGLRGGKVRVRAKINKLDKRSLEITELPYGKTTGSLIDSIIAANDKGKIKIKKIEDKTSANVQILVHLYNDVSPDVMIDALYAFTDCEVSISPNSCVIEDDKPKFLGVTELLKNSADWTLQLLKEELLIRKGELNDSWHFSSLEKIFIENRIYILIEECETWDSIIETIDKGLDPFKHLLRREVVYDDIVKLTEIRIKRISKYDSFKADEYIKSLEEEMKKIDYNLAHIVEFTIDYFTKIKDKFGKGRERKTEIRNFDNIVATQVVIANEKLYVNWKDGFAGTSLKKDEFVCECSDIDDIIIFRKDGSYIITKVSEKFFIGTNAIHIDIFKKNDDRTIYNVVYRDGKTGYSYIKRFAVKGITRDKEYDVTKGEKMSQVLYFSANPNGEAETIKVTLKPRPRLKKRVLEFDFSELAIKNRNSIGNILTKYAIHKIVMVEKGVSTLGGMNLWFDKTVFRLNTEERGIFLGEFKSDDRIAVLTKSGIFRLTSYELSNHFEEDLLIIEKYDPEKIYAAVFFDADQKYFYLKRFTLDDTDRECRFIGDNSKSYLVTITNNTNPLLEVFFGGKHAHRDNEIINAEEFISVKSYKARGKRISNYEIEKCNFFVTDNNEKDDSKDEENQNENEIIKKENEPDFEIIRPKKENGEQKTLDLD